MAVIRQIEKEFKVYHRPSLKSMTLLLERYQRYLRKLEEVDEDLLLAYYSMPIAFRKEKRIIIEKLESRCLWVREPTPEICIIGFSLIVCRLPGNNE